MRGTDSPYDITIDSFVKSNHVYARGGLALHGEICALQDGICLRWNEISPCKHDLLSQLGWVGHLSKSGQHALNKQAHKISYIYVKNDQNMSQIGYHKMHIYMKIILTMVHEPPLDSLEHILRV